MGTPRRDVQICGRTDDYINFRKYKSWGVCQKENRASEGTVVSSAIYPNFGTFEYSLLLFGGGLNCSSAFRCNLDE